MSELLEVAKGKAAQPEGENVVSYIRKWEGSIVPALPKHVDKDRFVRMSLQMVSPTYGIRHLAECTPESIVGGLMIAAKAGIELNSPLGHAWLLPFRTNIGTKEKPRYAYQAQFVLGYKGVLDLAWRSGKIKDIAAREVYEADEFDVVYGSTPKLTHKPVFTERGEIVLYYAIARFAGGGHANVVLTPADIEKYRARSKAKDTGPWKTDYVAMACKTCVLRMKPVLPLSSEQQRVLAADETIVNHTPGDEIWKSEAIDVDASEEEES